MTSPPLRIAATVTHQPSGLPCKVLSLGEDHWGASTAVVMLPSGARMTFLIETLQEQDAE